MSHFWCTPPLLSKTYQDDCCWNRYNLALDTLKNILSNYKDNMIYVYVVRSTKINANGDIYHEGTGPNIECGLITLTNCKHRMRCDIRRRMEDGELDEDKVWIAGLTTRDKKYNPFNKHFLFYLMKVEKFCNSFMDVWNYVDRYYKFALKSKNARFNPLGDLYEPKPNATDPFDPNSYYDPHDTHPHHRCKDYRNRTDCWKSCNRHGCWILDIRYACVNEERPYILVGDKTLSFLWSQVKIVVNSSDLTKKAVKRVLKKQRVTDYWILKISDFVNCIRSFQARRRKLKRKSES